MTDLVAEANRRIDELEAELKELRTFVAVAERLSDGTAIGEGSKRKQLRHTPSTPAAGRNTSGSSPKVIVEGVFDILQQANKPVERRQIVEQLAERGITVPGLYPNKNLATILWRHQRLFEHIQGVGYRWTGEPLPQPKEPNEAR
jgi:hypothetical protein